MNSQLLDYLKKIDFFAKLVLGILEQKVVALSLWTTTAAIPDIESLHEPKSAELVRKCLA